MQVVIEPCEGGGGAFQFFGYFPFIGFELPLLQLVREILNSFLVGFGNASRLHASGKSFQFFGNRRLPLLNAQRGRDVGSHRERGVQAERMRA